MRQILAEMETMLSYGSTQAFDKSGGRVKATGGNRPPGDSSPAHELYRVLYARCSSAAERENVIVAARVELESFTLGKASVEPEPGSLHWKRRIANDDRSLVDVLRVYGISRASYFRYRRDYRKDAA